MPRSKLEVADIFRRHGDAYRQKHDASLSTVQRRVMTAIELCRTAALGGHVEQCDHCGCQRISYNSCRNRHCPKCQSLARARWLDDRRSEVLDTEYFHVVFTMPKELAAIAYQNKELVYGILFRAAADTLRIIAADPKHLGAEIGFFAVLHTWGQNPLHHPHLHCVIPGGGLSPDGARWISCRKGFFLPVAVLSCLFRRLFLEYLTAAFDAGKLKFFHTLEPLWERRAFLRTLAPLWNAKWVVHAKRPFAGPEQVLDYVGRYTHRVAISNNRLESMDDANVSFRWKDYRDYNKQKTMTLTGEEFSYGRLGCVNRVIKRFLFRFHLRFHWSAHTDYSNSASEFRQPFLEFLAIVIAGCFFDLAPDLFDAPINFSRVACAANDCGVVLVDDDALGAPELVHGHILKLETEIFGDHLSARQHRDVLQHGLAAVPKAWRPDGAALQGAADGRDCQHSAIREFEASAVDGETRRVRADLAVLGAVAIAAFVPRPCANRLEFDRELSENERSDEIAQPVAEPFTKVA